MRNLLNHSILYIMFLKIIPFTLRKKCSPIWAVKKMKSVNKWIFCTLFYFVTFLKKFDESCNSIYHYKIRTEHDIDFLNALLVCKSVISYTFGIMLFCNIIWYNKLCKYYNIFTLSSVYWPPNIFTSISENRKLWVWK